VRNCSLFTSVFFFFAAVSASAEGESRLSKNEAISKLKKIYASEVARSSKLAAESPLGKAVPYYLTYGTSSAQNADQYVGNILRSIELQDPIIDETIQKESARLVRKAPGNHLMFDAGFKVLEKKIGLDCAKSLGMQSDCFKAAKLLMKIYDFRDQDLSPSALMFFDTVKEKFNDPLFVERAKGLHAELEKVVEAYARNPNHLQAEPIFEIAMRVCQNDRKAAIELLALSLGRDIGTIKYFEYVKPYDRRLMRVMGETPNMVRLITELDQSVRKSTLDWFSYNGLFRTKNIKNYYFWCGAYAAQRLEQAGISPKVAQRVVMEMPRQYKSFNSLQGTIQGFMSKFGYNGFWSKLHNDEAAFRRDVFEVIKTSGDGARFGLGSAPGKSCVHQALEFAL
jgi:hypothetical protein